MTYPVGSSKMGWLWEHRAVVVSVCLLVIAADSVLLGSGFVAFFPSGVLLIAAGMVAALVAAVLVLIWLSSTASNLPPDAKPTI